jgi:hypothetical protein
LSRTLASLLAAQTKRFYIPEGAGRGQGVDLSSFCWFRARLPGVLPDHHPESALDAARALIGETTGVEEQFQLGAAQTEAAIRGWWARQR